MAQVFREVPDALSRTVDIAHRCNVKVERIPNPFPGIQGAGRAHGGQLF